MTLLDKRGTIACDKQQKRIHLNVGGEKHSPYISTLKNLPDSPLAWIVRNECKKNLDFDPVTGVYFFDRHPGIFSQVLSYFQTGKLHCPRDVCGPMFQRELNFWGIDETQMEACCWPNYTEHREIQENLKILDITSHPIDNGKKNNKENTYENNTIVSSRLSKLRRFQRYVWEILDEPYSSRTAKVFGYMSLGVIVLSIFTYTSMTMSIIKDKKLCEGAFSNATYTDEKKCDSEALKTIKLMEAAFAIWFTVEILLRFTFCPSKSAFMKNTTNWVDLIALIPVYLFIVFGTDSNTIMILNMVRYVRIFRFFKLLYDLHILGKTLQASMEQLLILVLILCVPVVIFSSIVYYAEYSFGDKESKDDFTDIPTTVWWSIVTMTTVGYGRISPRTALGRLFGGMAAVIGILIVSMTASVIGSSFQQYYQVALTQLKIPAKNENELSERTEKITLLSLIQRDGKTSSIQSEDSKDSGYGRSPVPPSDPDEMKTPPRPKKEKNVIVAISHEENIQRRRRRTTDVQLI